MEDTISRPIGVLHHLVRWLSVTAISIDIRPDGGGSVEHQRRVPRVLFLSMAIVALVSCATQEPFPDSRIEQAQSREELESVYEELQVRAGSGVSDDSHLSKQIKRVGLRLARMHARDVRSSLEETRSDDGFVPMTEIERHLPAPAKLPRWSENLANKLSAELEQERKKTTSRLKQITQKLQSLPDDAYLERLQRLEAVQELSRNGRRYAAQRQNLTETMLEEAQAALDEGQLDSAEKRLKALDAEAPELDGLAELMRRVQRQRLVNRIRENINEQKFEEAFSRFRDAPEKVRGPEWTQALQPSLETLWNRFQTQLTTATRHRDLATAHAAFKRVNLLDDRTGAAFGPKGPGVTDFAEGVYRHAQEAEDSGRPAVALGALLVLRQARPEFPDLEPSIRRTLSLIAEQAVPRVAVSKFESTAQFDQVGGAVSAKLIQKLFSDARDDVRLVERDQLKEVLREQELNTLSRSSEGFSLGAADYLLQGSVLEARVESSKNTGERTERVVVERRTEPNPEYAKWQELNSEKKKKVTEPPQQIEVPVQEDVTYEVGIHRKYGLLNMSYRVIETSSASFVHTDTVSVEKEVIDQSSQGVSIGDFEVAFSVAELPSDAQLMTNLLDEAASKISDQLEELFDDPKARYLEDARKLAAGGDFRAAADAAAKAYALAEQQAKTEASIAGALKTYALRSL